MKLAILILLMTTGYLSKAAIDTSATYIVIMNNGSEVKGKILDLKKGEYIKILSADGNAQTISWDAFKDYKNITAIDSEKIEKLKQKHETWMECTLIMGGDTQYARIKNNEEKSGIVMVENYTEKITVT